jgi:hypothetical protein
LVRTTAQRLLPKDVSGYSVIEAAPGEPETLRDDLGGDPIALSGGGARVLLRLLHLTDLHVIDAGSPARSDWVEVRATDSKWRPLLHMARPHDLLANWGSAAFSRAIAATAADGGAGFADLAVFTGDNIDNAQRNELAAFMALGNGGSFAFPYEGPQRSSWAADARSAGPLHRTATGLWPFWLPDGGEPDRFRSEWGFPVVPGLLDAASGPTAVDGIGLPWISAVGNHDVMRQGTVFSTDRLEAIAVGGSRSLGGPAGFDPDVPLDAFMGDPAVFSDGEPRFPITPDAARSAIDLGEFVRVHRDAGIPGFETDSADYVYDNAHVRVIVLDTNHPTGHYQGSVGLAQLAWLDDRLREWVGRPVVVASHHGSVAIDNTYRNPTRPTVASAPISKRCCFVTETSLPG